MIYDSSTYSVFVYSQQLIPYTTVITNIGGHYNPDTYTFVCPYRGVYVFTVSTNAYNDQLVGELYKNDQLLIRTFANEDFRDSATASVVTECEMRDSVYVYAYTGGEFDCYWSPAHFSGYLLHKY